MREERGAEIVDELTGKKPPVVLDPVLMFNQEEWERLIPVQKEIDKPYIFAYFLGNNSEYRKVVKNIAKNNGYKVVTMRHLDQYVESDEDFGDIALYDVAPDRFLNLLRGAEVVCTDSFHGSCFSILHQKPFIVFNRYSNESKHSKNSRIDTLCNNLGLTDRRYVDSEKVKEQLEDTINYSEVNSRLEKLRKETNTYLDKAFDIL